MSEIFLKIINMSISASYIVLAVLLLRLILKKAPKWISVVLWGVVAVRLVCPFSMESVLSLIPSSEVVSPNIMTDKTPTINTGIPVINSTINPIISGSFTPGPGDSANPLQIWIPILTAIWIVGMVALLIYMVISYARVRRKIGTAVLIRDNIYQSENVVSPFVLGIIKPKIYLPFNMNEKDMEHVVAHEMAHIRRKDHLWKPLGFLLLTLHWFNPLMWLGYVLLCRDIELACDEKVIKELDHDARADYSEALLTCSVNRRMIAACPLAFGEVGVKDRVKSVLNYKKPAFWIILAAIVVCLAVIVCFLTDPIDKDNIGVNNISAERVDSNIVNLKLDYSYPTGGYSVHRVSESDGEYCGDGIKDYDGSLGKYRILIKFGDTEPSKEFKKKYPAGEVIELENSPIKIRVKRVHPQDHGFYLYVGFDSPIIAHQIENAKLKTFGGSIEIPINVLSNDFIGFFPPSSVSNECLFFNVLDFGSDLKYATINFDRVRFEDGNMIFDIYWTNEGPDNIYIGPYFEVYKYNDSELEKLENFGDWTANDELLAGKEMTADGESDRKYQCVTSYNLSGHYDVLTPGKYRFEAHGAWVEFQIIKVADGFSFVYDTAIFDVDDDGKEEICSLRHGYTSGEFSFIFMVQDKETGNVEFDTVICSQCYDLSFQKGDDGVTRVQGITQGENPETHLFDISIKDGYVYLTENGVYIGEIY